MNMFKAGDKVKLLPDGNWGEYANTIAVIKIDNKRNNPWGGNLYISIDDNPLNGWWLSSLNWDYISKVRAGPYLSNQGTEINV